MKRSDFKARMYVPAPKAPLAPVTRQVNSGPSARGEPAPKRDYVRSRALLDACGNIECQRCSAPCAVGAHSNWAIHGKGGHIKADDNRIAALCSYCHHDVDQGNTLRERGKQLVWWNAHVKTVNTLIERGLWPDDAPVPDLTFPPEWL